MRMQYVAVRTASVDNLGHVGVGFQNDDGTWTIGGVEGDPDKTILWGAVAFGDNGGWVEEHKTLQEVAVIFHALGYDGLKIIEVIDDNPNLANLEIKSFPTRGYNVVNNNCLSATIDVLTAYGVKNCHYKSCTWLLMTITPMSKVKNIYGIQARVLIPTSSLACLWQAIK